MGRHYYFAKIKDWFAAGQVGRNSKSSSLEDTGGEDVFFLQRESSFMLILQLVFITELFICVCERITSRHMHVVSFNLISSLTLIELLFSFDQVTRLQKTLMQTHAYKLDKLFSNISQCS